MKRRGGKEKKGNETEESKKTNAIKDDNYSENSKKMRRTEGKIKKI